MDDILSSSAQGKNNQDAQCSYNMHALCKGQTVKNKTIPHHLELTVSALVQSGP
jgi:hypothetical protein